VVSSGQANDEAYAFANESYAYLPRFNKPDWSLARGVYRITVRIKASNLAKARAHDFRLEYLGPDFSRFELQNLK